MKTDKSRPHEQKQERDASRDELRELSEVIGLYRSAMQHVAERQAAQPWSMPEARTRHPWRSWRVGLLLIPALAAALAVAVLAPGSGHFQQGSHAAAAPVATSDAPNDTEARAGVDDTVLMNQIDSEVSEDVPEALAPLAELSEQSNNNNQPVSEKTNVSQN